MSSVNTSKLAGTENKSKIVRVITSESSRNDARSTDKGDLEALRRMKEDLDLARAEKVKEKYTIEEELSELNHEVRRNGPVNHHRYKDICRRQAEIKKRIPEVQAELTAIRVEQRRIENSIRDSSPRSLSDVETLGAIFSMLRQMESDISRIKTNLGIK